MNNYKSLKYYINQNLLVKLPIIFLFKTLISLINLIAAIYFCVIWKI